MGSVSLWARHRIAWSADHRPGAAQVAMLLFPRPPTPVEPEPLEPLPKAEAKTLGEAALEPPVAGDLSRVGPWETETIGPPPATWDPGWALGDAGEKITCSHVFTKTVQSGEPDLQLPVALVQASGETPPVCFHVVPYEAFAAAWSPAVLHLRSCGLRGCARGGSCRRCGWGLKAPAKLHHRHGTDLPELGRGGGSLAAAIDSESEVPMVSLVQASAAHRGKAGRSKSTRAQQEL
eukprot:Skav221688  [mRNA]  locus=scaffold1494:288665:292160:+ [translate_table: standard]